MKTKKKIKLALVCLVALAAASYLVCWYMGTQIPAWHALIWSWFVFWQDLDDYSREP